ncbi:MAG: lysine--tRNA ligase [Aeromonas sp.]
MSEQTITPVVDQALEYNNEMTERRSKLAALRAQGNPFPNDFRRDSLSGDLHAEFDDKSAEQLTSLGKQVSIAGRIMTRRIMGKASFATLQDMAGKIQIYVTRDDLPEDFYNEQFKKWDLGDIVGVEGTLFKTQTGELSIHVSNIRLLTKALRPLPEKHKGLTDQEARCRQRYLDLIANDDSRKAFVTRTKVVAGIRKFLNDKRFMEVETPMMQVIPGGASARPFITHHNALDIDMYMRVSPELYLKRLVVGGFERVYEINRNFRNEGISVRHNPEFTMLEFYMAYADYHDLMDLTEEMLRTLAQDILGDTKIHYAKEGEEGLTIDFGQPFQRLTMVDSILKFNADVTRDDLSTLEKAIAVAKRKNIDLMASWELGHVITAIFEETVEHMLLQPTFITDYPAAVSPLARRNDHNPDVTDRFEFFIGTRELANGYSELNDAEDQAARFQAQVDQKDAGDDEAMFYDADFVTALEHGLPPTAGQGIGIDRLVMLFTNSHTIRDVILFPALRPQN